MRVIASLLVAVLAACSDDTSVSLVGESPTDQAEDIASAVCEREQQCGKPKVYCESTGGSFECTGLIEFRTFSTCYEAARTNALDDLVSCDPLTREQETTIERCINGSLADTCVTQAEVDAKAVEAETNGNPGPLRPPSPSCVEMEAIFDACAP
jgi:hypothetical protein